MAVSPDSRARLRRIAGSIVLPLCAPGGAFGAGELLPPSKTAPVEVVEWIGTQARPLSTVSLSGDVADLAPLREIVGNARLVGFGEGMHNTHELWSLRNRLFAWLVQELGFTAIALETGFLDGMAADDYVQGEPVDPHQAAHGVFSWASGVFAENLELIDWMRRYNAGRAPQDRVRLYGLEILSCGEFDGRWLVEPALDFLTAHGPASASELRRRFLLLLPKFNEKGHAGASPEERRALLEAVEDLVIEYERSQSRLIASATRRAYERAYHLAIVSRQMLAYLRMGGKGRDIADAQNLRWVLEREGPRARVFVFAHDGHLAKRASLVDRRGAAPTPMGELLHGSLVEPMVVIGSLFYRGTGRELFGLYGPVNGTFDVLPSRPDSLNGAFAAAGLPLFLLDLRKVPTAGSVHQWFAQPQGIRDVAGYDLIDVRASFDALLFVERVSPQRLLAPSVPGKCRDGGRLSLQRATR